MAEKMTKVIANENGVGNIEVKKGDEIEIPASSVKHLEEIGSIVKKEKEKTPAKKEEK